MTLRTAALAALACLVAAAPAGAAAAPKSWDAYANPRFNFAICYPPTFKGQGEADNSDGQRFRTRDGAELAAYGSNQAPGERIDSGLADTLKALAGPDAHVTYRVQKANWLVASGVGSKGEFYVKRVLRHDQLLNWELVYPAAAHALYAPLTTQMLSCFTHGFEDGS